MNVTSQYHDNIPNELTIEQFRLSFEQLEEILLPNKNQFDLRILLCFMCGGGENNDIENFFSQLSARFSLMITNSSFIINTFIGRSNRKVKF